MAGREHRTQVRTGRRLAIAAVAAGLVTLTVVVAGGSIVAERTAARTDRAVQLANDYRDAAQAVTEEESAERKYRLEPGPDPLAEHRAAQTTVRDSLEQVRREGSAQDRKLVEAMLSEHASYVTGAGRLFAAVLARAPASEISAIDTGQVDPIFSRLEAQITQAATDHRHDALAAVDHLQHLSQLTLALNVATVLAGLALIASTGIAVVRSQRRLRVQSALNRHQSLHDPLTGLPNRALFQDRVGQALTAARRDGSEVAVMLVDLDRFKEVNDTLGHQYGDHLLWQVAERFTKTLREQDTVARLGGDEFAVLLPGTGGTDAATAAQRLTASLDETFVIREISVDVEASIGIAFADPGSDVDSLLRHADIAMYEAKSQHIAFATYEQGRDDNTVARLGLLGELRRAIQAGELTLHYQPKVNTVTNELHSVEALVRWQHPTRGLLPPGDFIPIAENTAVIHALTAEVLRVALLQARAWFDAGHPIPVAVNLSARSLHDPAFPQHVARQLDASGLPPELLQLELTESAIMIDPDGALHTLEALHRMGIMLSIDDFGTGYSSMAYLKALPVRELKIDRSFVTGMTFDPSDAMLVQSAIDLAHNLGLHVVAEGVEDHAAQQLLAQMGCDLAQGYHIHKPMQAQDLEPWLQDHLGPSHLATTRRLEDIASPMPSAPTE